MPTFGCKIVLTLKELGVIMSQFFNWDNSQSSAKALQLFFYFFKIIYLLLLLAYYFKEEVEMEIMNE
jgi:hypothetical protein